MQVHLPKGRLLAICPFESHHDAGFYPPDAWQFDPDRSPLTICDGAAVVPGVAGLAFGGGAYRCPGRFFAEMEIAVLTQLVLCRLDLTLVSEIEQNKRQERSGAASEEVNHPSSSRLPSWLWRVLGRSRSLCWGLGLLDVGGWEASGDARGLLPRCNLRRLVGLKVPAEPCRVLVRVRD